MKKFKLASTIVAGSMFLSVAGNALAADYADVIFVVDESGSMSTYHTWLGNMITTLDGNLTANGVGDGTDYNQYGLVGFGGDYSNSTNQQGHTHLVGGTDWGSALQFQTATSTLVTVGGNEDGWQAIDFALSNYTFRSGAALNIVLVTDEDRDDNDGGGVTNIEYADILAALNAKGGVLNSVVDVTYKTDGSTVVGVSQEEDSSLLGYIPDGSGGFSTEANPVFYSDSGTTQENYIELAWATGGAAWDLNQLQLGGNAADSFTAAFVDIKTQEIIEDPGVGGEVPEPATMLLFGTGLAGLAGISRRKNLKK